MDIFGLLTVPNWLLVIVFILGGFYIYFTWHFNDLKAWGLKGPKPYPLIGNMDYAIKYGFRDMLEAMGKEQGKTYGFFSGRLPMIATTDIKILRQVLVKDFQHFSYHQKFVLRGCMSRSIFDLGGQEWKHVRTHLTPSFSTSKLKQMNESIISCAQVLIKHLEKYADDGQPFEAKAMTSTFTMDVIARTIFSLKLDAKSDQSNTFVQKAMRLFHFSFSNPFIAIIVFFPFLVPVLTNVFGVKSALPSDVENFFRGFIITLLEERRKSPEKYNDLIERMLNSEEDLKTADSEVKDDLKYGMELQIDRKGLTTDEIVAQCMLFFTGGYETTSGTLSFVMYHLALDPEIQDKVYNEIKDVVGDEKSPSYEQIAKLSYMEMVIYETLRLYPSFASIDRRASQDMEYEGIKIPKDTVVVYPVKVLHMDPEVYPEPDKFDPERFSPEEKAKRDPLYFGGFGEGPRKCVGIRLAMLEMKMALVLLLKSFRILRTDKTQVPLEMLHTLFPQAKDGIYVKVERR